MGATNRNIEFTNFIKKQFPKASIVYDIAGGNGELSKLLLKNGFSVTLVEKKPRVNGKGQFKIIRKYSNELHLAPSECNLIVGMHPDQATWDVIRLAKEANCSFAIVPCCEFFPESADKTMGWIKWLMQEAKRMGFSVSSHALKIQGKNTVIFGNYEG